MTALLTTNLGATPLLGRGKVRDLYAVDNALLLVATDRISAFDHVLATGIPGKGKILTRFRSSGSSFSLSSSPTTSSRPTFESFPPRCNPMPISWKAARCWSSGQPCFPSSAWRAVTWPVGLEGVPKGWNRLRHSAARRSAGWIAASRAALHSVYQGRSRNPRREHQLCRHGCGCGEADAAALKHLTLAIYKAAAKHAESRGLILADTKFEFGRTPDGLSLPMRC